MEDLRVVGILDLENFERQKELCSAKFVKQLDSNKQELKLRFFRTISWLEFQSVEETQKLETVIGITGLM